MRIGQRFANDRFDQNYMLSLVDSDGDKLVEDAPLRAPNLQSAWEQALAIAFRACRGSGAVPVTISVRRHDTLSDEVERA